jgi:phage anti-repressor protein
MRNAIEEAAELNRWKERVKKVRLENEARWIAAAIKKQKNQNNRLAAAAAVNLNNAKSLNKVFKNNKTVLGRLRRLVGRLRR